MSVSSERGARAPREHETRRVGLRDRPCYVMVYPSPGLRCRQHARRGLLPEGKRWCSGCTRRVEAHEMRPPQALRRMSISTRRGGDRGPGRSPSPLDDRQDRHPHCLPMHRIDVWRMIVGERPYSLQPKSAATPFLLRITAYLEAGGTLRNARAMARIRPAHDQAL